MGVSSFFFKRISFIRLAFCRFFICIVYYLESDKEKCFPYAFVYIFHGSVFFLGGIGNNFTYVADSSVLLCLCLYVFFYILLDWNGKKNPFFIPCDGIYHLRRISRLFSAKKKVKCWYKADFI